MSGTDSDVRARLNTDQPHSARIWNYLLGGKDNFDVDRAAADAVIAQMPEIRVFASAGRDFLKRAIGFLAGEAGIRQFIDIGSGLPTADNTHELAQAIAAGSKIVYHVEDSDLVDLDDEEFDAEEPDGGEEDPLDLLDGLGIL